MSGYFALMASSRIFWSLAPSDVENVHDRMRRSVAEAKSWRAAYLFQAFGHNEQIAVIRVRYLGWARRAFNAALVMLGLVMALIVAFVIATPS